MKERQPQIIMTEESYKSGLWKGGYQREFFVGSKAEVPRYRLVGESMNRSVVDHTYRGIIEKFHPQSGRVTLRCYELDCGSRGVHPVKYRKVFSAHNLNVVKGED